MVDQGQLRLLPSVDELLHSSGGRLLVEDFCHGLVLRALRTSIAQARAAILSGSLCPSQGDLLRTAEELLRQEQQPLLRSLINATGVIINTNLGRAPLSREALAAVQRVATGYANLEYDLEAGERGSRHTHIAPLLRDLTGA